MTSIDEAVYLFSDGSFEDGSDLVVVDDAVMSHKSTFGAMTAEIEYDETLLKEIRSASAENERIKICVDFDYLERRHITT